MDPVVRFKGADDFMSVQRDDAGSPPRGTLDNIHPEPASVRRRFGQTEKTADSVRFRIPQLPAGLRFDQLPEREPFLVVVGSGKSDLKRVEFRLSCGKRIVVNVKCDFGNLLFRPESARKPGSLQRTCARGFRSGFKVCFRILPFQKTSDLPGGVKMADLGTGNSTG